MRNHYTEISYQDVIDGLSILAKYEGLTTKGGIVAETDKLYGGGFGRVSILDKVMLENLGWYEDPIMQSWVLPL